METKNSDNIAKYVSEVFNENGFPDFTGNIYSIDFHTVKINIHTVKDGKLGEWTRLLEIFLCDSEYQIIFYKYEFDYSDSNNLSGKITRVFFERILQCFPGISEIEMNQNHNLLSYIPAEFAENIQTLKLMNVNSEFEFNNILKFVNVKKLVLDTLSKYTIPPEISLLQQIECIGMNMWMELPPEISQLSQLKYVFVRYGSLLTTNELQKKIHLEIFDMKSVGKNSAEIFIGK